MREGEIRGSDLLVANPVSPLRQPLAHSRSLRLGRHSRSGAMYALTKCCLSRQALLASDKGPCQAADIVWSVIREMEARGIWACLGCVIMPDHVHWVIQLKQGDLSRAVKSFSTFTARSINRAAHRSGPLWQKGFYEHFLRGEEDLRASLEYMWMNPVRANLVSSPELWSHSHLSLPARSGTRLYDDVRRQEAAPTPEAKRHP